MRKLLLATTGLIALSAAPASADVIQYGLFTSDHCTGTCAGNSTGGPAQTSFGYVKVTDNGLGTGGATGTLTFDFTLLNGNEFANGGQQVIFGFNLKDNPTITYSGLSSDFVVAGVAPQTVGLVQKAGSLHGDGLGDFEYGVDGAQGFNGGSDGVTTLKFSISGVNLDWTDLNETLIGGDPSAIFGLDILSGTNGKTGFVDFTGNLTPTPFGSPVPEASTWAMMLLGFLGVGLFGMRGRAGARSFRMFSA